MRQPALNMVHKFLWLSLKEGEREYETTKTLTSVPVPDFYVFTDYEPSRNRT